MEGYVRDKAKLERVQGQGDAWVNHTQNVCANYCQHQLDSQDDIENKSAKQLRDAVK